MVPKTPVGSPSEIRAGDSVKWKIADLSDYPMSEGWQLLYSIQGEKALQLAAAEIVAGTGDDDGYWVVTVAKTKTSPLNTGGRDLTYRLVPSVEGSGAYLGEAVTLEASTALLIVHPDPRTAAAGSFQSTAEQMVTTIEAALLAAGDQADLVQYTVAGRAVQISRKDALQELAKWKQDLWRERNPGTFAPSIKMRFGRAS